MALTRRTETAGRLAGGCALGGGSTVDQVAEGEEHHLRRAWWRESWSLEGSGSGSWSC
jgi:hypothetical protein